MGDDQGSTHHYPQPVVDPAELDYELPEPAIAQVPVEPRDASRLLVDRGPTAAPDHRHVRDLVGLLRPGDLLVVNETKVLPVRLRCRKPTGGAVEVLLLEPAGDGSGDWEALVRPSRRLPPGATVKTADTSDDRGAVLVLLDDLGGGRRRVRIEGDLSGHGEVPLPPYIHAPLPDPDRYQTVYATVPGSAAAPTAGLHLTVDLLDQCRTAGVDTARVDLTIGSDTFRPITTGRVEDHPMHSERYAIPEATMAACERAARVVAVGTTVVRGLEAAAASGALEGRTDLFIRRGFRFQVVDVLLTNFHMPRTTLLALVDAFVGPRWRDLYAEALRTGYRFLSFGDAILLERANR